MSSRQVKPETYIRSMPFGIFRQLSYILDLPSPLHRNWEAVASAVPRSRGSDQLKYSPHQILMFRQELQRPNGSPTISLLQDWGTQNATAQDLVDILLNVELYSAAEIVLPEYTRIKRHQQEESQLNDGYAEQPTENYSFPPDSPMSADDTDSNKSSHIQVESSSPGSTSGTAKVSSSEKSEVSERIESDSLSSPDVDSPQDSPRQPQTNRDGTEEKTQVDDVGSTSTGEQISESDKARTKEAVGEAQQSLEESVSDAKVFPYSALSEMTNDFNVLSAREGGNRIGEGSFGEVYVGTQEDGKRVAVKKLKEGHTDHLKKIVNQFKTEVEVLSKYKHENIVNFLGYSCDGHRFCLVYEYMPNGSLEDRLCCRGGTRLLEWTLRLNIARDVARGICYLHRQNLIHRDIKSANVLLDEDFVAKVADFGLVRSGPTDPSRSVAVTTTVFGTSPYMPKEAFHGTVTTKLDTYSYGVVLLEMMTGLPVYDDNRDSHDLASHVEDQCDSDEEFLSIVDMSLQYDEITMTKLYQVAAACINNNRKRRPEMSEVLPKIELIVDSE